MQGPWQDVKSRVQQIAVALFVIALSVMFGISIDTATNVGPAAATQVGYLIVSPTATETGTPAPTATLAPTATGTATYTPTAIPTQPPKPTDTPPATIVPPSTPIANPIPYAVPGSWRLVKFDEFNDTTLDASLWEPNWFGKTRTDITQYVNSSEGQCFDPANILEGGGFVTLKLTADPCPSTAGSSAGLPFRGAILTTRPFYTFTPPVVVETRMWADGPADNRCNNWGSFWINGLPVTGREEYDVAECLSNKFAFHLNPGSVFGGDNGSQAIANDWHVFTIDWETSGATVYYDKTKIGTITQKPYTAAMYVIYENATHGVNNVTLPSLTRIDYIRWFKPL